MVQLNKICFNNRVYQVFMNDSHNRIILEIKSDINGNNYYEYPLLEELIKLTRKYFTVSNICLSNGKHENNIKNNKRFIKFAQKVIVSGVVIYIALNLPAEVKNYTVQTINNVTDYAVGLTKVDTIDELNEEFGANYITKDDCINSVKENPNLKEYEEDIIQYINDVHLKRENQNWWVLNENLKRMEIVIVPEEELDDNIDGSFNMASSKIKIREGLSKKKKNIVLRHELTHALTLITINIDNKFVDICFYYDDFSIYGKKILEMLTSIFNSYVSDYTDYSYVSEVKIFEPLIAAIGEKEITEPMHDGGIEAFIDLCKPYHDNIEEYLPYFETFFKNYYDEGKELDADFLNKFAQMTLNFYMKGRINNLKATDSLYIYDYSKYNSDIKTFVINLYDLVTKNPCDSSKNEPITLSYLYNEINEIEKSMLNESKLGFLTNVKNENPNRICFAIEQDEGDEYEITDVFLLMDEFGKTHLPVSHNTNYDFNNLTLVVEQTYPDEIIRLRIINDGDPYLIDEATYMPVNPNSNYLAKVKLIDYIRDKGIDFFSDHNNVYPYKVIYFDELNTDDYINDIISYYNEGNKNKNTAYTLVRKNTTARCINNRNYF